MLKKTSGFLLVFSVLLLSCSNKQSGQKITDKNYQSVGASVTLCSSGCPSGTTCDNQDYQGGQSPVCRPTCTKPGELGTQAGCSSSEICNPLTATCETLCNTTADCNYFFGASGFGICSTQLGNGYCQVTCTSDTHCSTFGPNLKCNNGFCSQACTGPSCPGGQQCLSGVCQFPACPGANCSTATNQCSAGFCVPKSCGTGPACGPQGFCNSGTSCGCGSGASCAAPETCSTQGPTGQCQCGGQPSCISGEACVNNNGTIQCQCGSTPGLTCGAGNTCNASGQCVCGTSTCSAGQTCNTSGECLTPNTCGNSSCTGSCVDNTCLPAGIKGDGTCATSCLAGQVCFSQQCLSACGAAGNYCLPSETCTNGKCNCGTASCSVGTICAGSQSSAQCITQECGDGYVTTGEFCDEGSASAYTAPNCPNGWSGISGSPCKPNNSGAGNGNNGHCATDCSAPCVLKNTTGGNFWPASSIVTALSDLEAVSTAGCTGCTASQNCQAGVCVQNSSVCPGTPCPVGQTCNATGQCIINSWSSTQGLTPTQCPNGLGIWISNGSYMPTSVIGINSSVAIYGGFSGGETSIYSRHADHLGTGTPLGQNAPSGTILQGSGHPILSIGDDATVLSVIFDGFQLLGGSSNSSPNVCSTAAARSTYLEEGAGGVTICKSAIATLQNLRISKNTVTNSALTANVTVNGGGIRNLGTMILKDSMISLNTAQNHGGGLSHEGAFATIERVTFFGNSAGFAGTAVPLCAAGGTVNTANGCPAGMICPTLGGACTGTPNAMTCTSTTDCPLGMTCPAGTCAGTVSPTWVPNHGGAIYANGGSGSALNVFASKFNANYSYGKGGGIYSNDTLNIVSSLFAGNWASNAGGGVYLSKTASSGSGGVASLYNLTLIDNAAYNQGGGGIYNEVSGSTIQSSLFRNNKGLFPVNNNNLAEWGGNRSSVTPAGGNFPLNQINSISDAVTFGTTMAGSSGVTGKGMLAAAKYTDMCPVIAYTYNNGICDGTQTCGTPSSGSCNTNGLSNCTFNINATVQNTCNLGEEFVDCAAPLYRNCAPVSGKAISDSTSATSLYPKDLAGGSLPATGPIMRGAYQGCTDGTCLCSAAAGVCSGATPVCSNGTCIQCTTDLQCSGNTPVCSNGVCVCSAAAGVCSGATPICEIQTGQCVICIQNTDCVAAGYADTCTNNICYCGSNPGPCSYEDGPGSCVQGQCPCGSYSNGWCSPQFGISGICEVNGCVYPSKFQDFSELRTNP